MLSRSRNSGQAGQLPGGLVDREPAGRLLDEHALGGEMAEHGVQRVRVAAGRRGQAGDVGVAGGDEVRQAQGGGDHQAPRRGQVEHPLQVDVACVRAFYHH